MKVPATCPGEQSKDDKKKLKAERQEASQIPPKVANGGPPEGVAEMPVLSRSNTMNSLSAGYGLNARRTVSGPGSGPAPAPAPSLSPSPSSSPRPPVDEVSDSKSTLKPPTSQPGPTRRNRVVAPPPAKYVSELPADEIQPTGRAKVGSDVPTGKMLYTYSAHGDEELTVEEGTEVTILEPDGTCFSISSVRFRLS